MVDSFALKLRTAMNVGLGNIARVYLYRLGLRTRLHPAIRLQADIDGDHFFSSVSADATQGNDMPRASSRWQEYATYFGSTLLPLNGNTPPWHRNPFVGGRVEQPGRPWWEIPDFDPTVGDIKTIWEPSRF